MAIKRERAFDHLRPVIPISKSVHRECFAIIEDGGPDIAILPDKDISAARSEEIHEECLTQLERLALIASLEEI